MSDNPKGEDLQVEIAEAELKKMIAEEIKKAKEAKGEKEMEGLKDVKVDEKALEDKVNAMLEAKLKDIKAPTAFPGMPAPVKELGDKRFFSEVLKGIKYKDQYLVKKYDLKMDMEDSKTLVEGIPGLGGYLVPDEYSNKIIDLVLQYSAIRPLCTIVPMAGKTINIPVESSGQTAYWIDENGQKTASNMAFTQLTINAYKLCALQKITDELLADANPAIDNLIMNMMAKVIANAEDRAFLGGTGGPGDPIVGIKNTVGVNLVPAGALLTFDDVFDAIGAAENHGATNISMVYSPRDHKTMRKLKGVDGQYLWAPAAEKNPPTIDGRPLYRDGNIPTNLGVGLNESYAIVGDFSWVYIGDRSGLVITAGLDGEDFSYDRTTYRAVKRVGMKIASANKLSVITGILPS
jgi:HK97 family phage major capsid protein